MDLKIPVFDELQFEETAHTYTLGGKVLPSVSKVMEPLSMMYYGPVDRGVLDKAAERGTAVHQAIENYIKYGIEDVPSEYKGYFDAFKLWMQEYNPIILGTECRTYHKTLQYAGTCDLPCIIQGETTCVDFKSSATINEMLTGVQLEAYSKAYKSHGFDFDKKAIVHLKKAGKYTHKAYKKNDVESWSVFGALLTVNNHLVKYGRA